MAEARKPSVWRRRSRAVVRGAFVLHSGNLGNRIVGGAGFTMLGIALRTLLPSARWPSLPACSRRLILADIAMATAVTELAALLGSFGFSNILIQRKVINRLQMDTRCSRAGLLVGFTLAAAVFLFSFVAGTLVRRCNYRGAFASAMP